MGEGGATSPDHAGAHSPRGVVPVISSAWSGQGSNDPTPGGELDEDERSFRGDIEADDRWLISEAATPTPEPTASLLFGALPGGGVEVGASTSATSHWIHRLAAFA